MGLRNIERIIDFESIEESFGLLINEAANKSDDSGCPQLHVVAACRNAYES